VNCRYARKQLADYSAGLIAGAQRDRLRDHVAKCPTCQHALVQFGQLDARLHSERLPASGALTRDVMRRVRAESTGGLPGWVRVVDSVGPLGLLVAAVPAIMLLLARYAEVWQRAVARAEGHSGGAGQLTTVVAGLVAVAITAGVVSWLTNRVGDTLT
jgi:hypothetical protein